MAALIIRPEIVDFIETLSTSNDLGLHLERCLIEKNSCLLGKRLDESHIKRDTGGTMILGIQKNGKQMRLNPPGSTFLEEGDILLAIGNDEQISQLRKILC